MEHLSEILTGKMSVGKLFDKENFYRIPEYQRPYSWKEEQCEQLFDDIFESDRENEYFLGTLIIQEIEKLGTGTKYDLIDGQQRITTLQILLAALRDKVQSEEYKENLQVKIYEKHNPIDGIPEKIHLEVKEKDFFNSFIRILGGTNQIYEYQPKPNNDAQKNLKNAVIIFRQKLEGSSEEDIKALIRYLSQKCILLTVAAKSFDDAYRLFTIINDRGLQLRRIDILKAQNLEPTIICDENERKYYSKIWEDMEDDLGSDEFESLISFLRTIEVKEKAKEDVLKEFNNKIFGKNIIERGKPFISYVQEYQDIYQRTVLDADVFDKCQDINLRNQSVTYKNLINIMRDFLPSNEWVPPLLYFYKKHKTLRLSEFFFKLESKFVADWIIGLTATKRTVNINAILKSVENLSATELVTSDVFDYNKSEFEKVLLSDIYGKSFTRYLMLKLEYLESEQNIERKYRTISVEHVLPQNPKNKSQWLNDFSEEERKYWTNKVANIILLSKRKNSSASNLDFNDKKQNYFKGKVTDLTRSQKILNYTYWTPNVLKQRQTEIVKLLTTN